MIYVEVLLVTGRKQTYAALDMEHFRTRLAPTAEIHGLMLEKAEARTGVKAGPDHAGLLQEDFCKIGKMVAGAAAGLPVDVVFLRDLY